MSFVHLHNHTQYSVLDGHGKIKEYVAAAKADGQTAIAITDHGTIAGAIEFYTECKAAGIKPIIGCELYVDLDVQEEKFPFHLTVLAANLQGYRDLVNVNTRAHKSFYYRPRISLRALMDEGLMANWIVLTGCPSSPINRLIRNGKMDEARALLQALSSASMGAAIEIMYHKVDEDKGFRKVQSDLLHAAFDLSKQVGNPLVLTNDCHYVGEEDERTHQGFLKQAGERIHGIEFSGSGFFLQTSNDMRHISEYLGRPDAYDNAGIIAEMVDLEIPEIEKPSWYVPSPIANPSFEIHQRCNAVLKMPEHYVGRFMEEMAVIGTSEPIMNSYLVAADLVEWCHSQGIAATGRGSMAGSLVSYLLGITSEDPVSHNLNFKRAVAAIIPAFEHTLEK